jgi:hypothetical protein
MGTGAVGHEQPAPKDYIAFGGELHVLLLHDPAPFNDACTRHNIDGARAASGKGTPQ